MHPGKVAEKGCGKVMVICSYFPPLRLSNCHAESQKSLFLATRISQVWAVEARQWFVRGQTRVSGKKCFWKSIDTIRIIRSVCTVYVSVTERLWIILRERIGNQSLRVPKSIAVCSQSAYTVLLKWDQISYINGLLEGTKMSPVILESF